MAKQAVLYCRNSRGDEDETTSVPDQESECRVVCEHNGWRVKRVFREPDRSASRYSKKERPEYREAVEYVRAGKADVLVCWESSRAQRDLEAYIKLRDVCAETGTLYSYKGRTYDLSRTDDRFVTGLDALLDARESDVTRDRVLRGVRTNAERGGPHGPILYGYRREYNPKTGKLKAQVPRADTAKIVRELADRVLSGETVYAVYTDLNARGVKPPRGEKWHHSTVVRILRNPGYIGARVYRGKVIGDAAWEPLLTESEHTRLVAKLDARKDPKFHREANVRYLLSGLAQCGKGDCGNPMVAQSSRATGSTARYLARPCHHVSRNVEMLDRHVSAYARLALAVRPDGPELMGLTREADSAAMDATRTARELREQLEGFYDQAADGGLTPEGLAAMEARLRPRIEAADALAGPTGLPAVVTETADPDPDVVNARWAALELSQKRELIRAILVVRVLPTVRGRHGFDPASVDVRVRFRAPDDAEGRVSVRQLTGRDSLRFDREGYGG